MRLTSAMKLEHIEITHGLGAFKQTVNAKMF